MSEVQLHQATLPLVPLCSALGVPRSTLYRRRAAPRPQAVRGRPANALSTAEEQAVLAIMNSPEFQDQAPAAMYATLLDRSIYLCSLRTMYRILTKHGEVRERRNQLRHPEYKKPELLATAPNQVWTWDITKLRGPVKWTYYYLYVMIDIYSRYIVGWLLADREDSTLAKQLIGESFHRQGLRQGHQLVIHADRGTSMKSKAVANFLADLGITKTHSRPHVSDDNPFSEAQFKTMKYRPDFPDRFGCQEDALAFAKCFFTWYNYDHKHEGIALLAPADVHYGRSQALLAIRAETLRRAFAAHPERFKGKCPVPLRLPDAVWINQPKNQETSTLIPCGELSQSR